MPLFACGCASQEQHSFNDDYNQPLPTAPKHYIIAKGTNPFKLTLSQGKPSAGQERVFDLKVAANTIAGHEGTNRGWQN